MGNYTNSMSSVEGDVNVTLNSIKYYFASRLSTFDDIWNICHNLSQEINEEVLDVFCLTLIDHWDKEKERYVLLCERCLIILEYNFARLEIQQMQLYDYSRFDTIRVGPLYYPDMSFNSQRHNYQLSIRLSWDSHKPVSQWQLWNPWSHEIPWITLTSHPLKMYIEQLLHSARSELDDTYFTLDYLKQIQNRYSIEMFHDKLFTILNSFQLRPRNDIPNLTNWSVMRTPIQHRNVSDDDCIDEVCFSRPGPTLVTLPQLLSNIIELYHPNNAITIVHYAPIICENYFNMPAAIFNHSRLGYYRLRLF